MPRSLKWQQKQIYNSVSPTVTVFWGAGEDHKAQKLTLPLDRCLNYNSAADALKRLVADCAPAGFGIGGEDVIDPGYRKAGKLDLKQFATNFDLSAFGILDNVEQILLPRFNTAEENRLPFRKLKAELYKLNVYSGPSGLFKKHVDTPRSESQIGPLVVCLPSPFNGGNLVVQHKGKEVDFDWSQKSENTIQWAALNSDCEHEIKTITEGERITLTYNLYVTDPIGGSIPPKSIVYPERLSLHGFLKSVFIDPKFMKMGGILGIYCSHSYPHTSPEVKALLPKALKGADLELSSVLKDLGMHVEVRPVIEDPSADYYGRMPLYKSYNRSNFLAEAWSTFLSSAPLGSSNLDTYWKFLLFSRCLENIHNLAHFAKKNNLDVGSNDSTQDRLLGRLERYIATDEGEQMEISDIISSTRNVEYLPGIAWINSEKHQEMDFSYVAYGNEASIGTLYASAALIVGIPPFLKREELASAQVW